MNGNVGTAGACCKRLTTRRTGCAAAETTGMMLLALVVGLACFAIVAVAMRRVIERLGIDLLAALEWFGLAEVPEELGPRGAQRRRMLPSEQRSAAAW